MTFWSCRCGGIAENVRHAYCGKCGDIYWPDTTGTAVHWMADMMGMVGSEGPELFIPECVEFRIDARGADPFNAAAIYDVLHKAMKPDTRSPQAKAVHSAVMAVRNG